MALNADLAKGLHNVLEAIVFLNSALNLFISGLASSKAADARKASSAKGKSKSPTSRGAYVMIHCPATQSNPYVSCPLRTPKQ